MGFHGDTVTMKQHFIPDRMSEMEKPTCGDCAFFQQTGDAEIIKLTGYGDCVRYPQPIQQSKGYWCGEFCPRETIKFKEPERTKSRR